MSEMIAVAVPLAPCPFCGGKADPAGWLNGKGERGPECEACGATAENAEVWNKRLQAIQPEPVAIFETYIQPAHLDAWTDQQPERTHWCVKLLAPVADIPNGSHLYIAQALAVSDDSVRSGAAPTPTSPNDQANRTDLELALFAENQKRLETEQLRDQLVAALEDAVRLLRAAGYAMSGTATTPMLATIATAKAAQHGALIDEDSKQPASAQPVAQGGTRP